MIAAVQVISLIRKSISTLINTSQGGSIISSKTVLGKTFTAI